MLTEQSHSDCPLVRRLPFKFTAEDNWLVTRPLFPGGESRTRSLFDRVAKLSDDEVSKLLAEVRDEFSFRHKDINSEFKEHFRRASLIVGEFADLSEPRQLLLGAYFTMEYSIASAALFNPSIVAHPNQRGLKENSLRFIMSLRATGEGHVSSIVFREGVISPDCVVDFKPPSVHRHRMRLSPDRRYHKGLFCRKLRDLVIDERAMELVMSEIPDEFTIEQLEHVIEKKHQEFPDMYWLGETTDSMGWLARENYRLRLPEGADASELVVFPQTDNESMGIEDLRMVRFVDDDESVTYYGTYSAYNGTHVLPQLIETRDFRTLQINTLNGAAVQNKGMALFPRRIGGHYCMSSRIDGENLFISYSDVVEFWETAEMLQVPKQPWEFMQIGNCGSPIETSEGWLLMTHGVGPMRKYCIGAMLLDLNDPLRVIGHLDEPLLVPIAEERDGYVPNVVYSCGSIVCNDCLYIPYAMSDSATGFAVVSLDKLLERLRD